MAVRTEHRTPNEKGLAGGFERGGLSTSGSSPLLVLTHRILGIRAFTVISSFTNDF